MTPESNAKRLIEFAGSASVLEALPVGVTLIDAQTRRIVYRNANSRAIAARSELPYDGIDTAARMGLLWPDGTPLEPHEIPGFSTLDRGEKTQNRIIVLPCLDGGSITLAMDSAPLFDLPGTLVGAMLTFREIDDESEMAQRLAKSERSAAAAERRRRFHALLAEAVRDLVDATAIAEITARLVGTHLKANRCSYGSVDVEKDAVRIYRGYVSGVPSSAGVYKLSQFGEKLVARQKAGIVDVVSDTATDPITADSDASTYAPMETRSFIGVPLVKEGRMVAFFTVQHREPRHWTAEEVRLVEEVADRTWAAIERVNGLRALEESEARHRALVEGLPQLTWTSGPDGLRDYHSPQWLAYTGRKAEESLGLRWLEAFHPDDREAVAESWKRSFEETVPFDATFRLRRHDGVYRTFRARGVPAYDGEGTIVKWMGASTDIHDLWVAQEALKTRAERQRRVAESAFRITHARSLVDILRIAAEDTRRALDARAVLVRLQNDAGGIANWAGSLEDGRFIWSTVGAKPDVDAVVGTSGESYRAQPVDLGTEALRQKLEVLGLGELSSGPTVARVAPMIDSKGDRLGILILCTREGEERDPEDDAVLVQFAQLATAAIENVRLTEGLKTRTEQLQRANAETFDRLARAAALRDEDTAEHTGRVGRLAKAIALEIGLDRRGARLIGRAAELHDLGKIGIPDSILRKPGRLTSEERAIMETHAELGATLLEGCEDPVLQCATTIARSHHERWDGTGYPGRLAGEAIPVEARIVSVADAYDAMTKDRPYRAAMSPEQAHDILVRGSGTQWDPQVVEALVRCVSRVTDSACRQLCA